MLKIYIKEIIRESIKNAQDKNRLPKFDIPEVSVEYPGGAEYGDYATSIALQLAKTARISPLEIAEAIKSEIKTKDRAKEVFDKIEAIKPGFINFFLTKNYLFDVLFQILEEGDRYGSSSQGQGKTMVIDYSAPNIAKPFGIGHLRSTIIGQAIYNLYRFLGWKCVGDNHLGDWGTQFGKLIYQIITKKLKDKTSQEEKDILENLTIEELEKLYVEFHQEAKDNPQMEQWARDWFKKLEDGDETVRRIWHYCAKISLREFDKIYELLGVEIDYAIGESFYEKMVPDIIQEVVQKKLAVESQGALIIQYPNNELPSLVFVKSDRATTYLTRDLATVKYRVSRWNPSLIVYEVGVDQSLYMKQLFLIVKLLGWDRGVEFFHVAHGLIRAPSGKFSTRRGKTILLEDVLGEAVKRAGEVLEGSGDKKDLPPEEKEELAKIIGVGAIKYNDLSQHYSRDIIFDWDKILNLKGNSGPYLQYTFARCKSVIRKSGLGEKRKTTLKNLNGEELKILRMICKFPEVVEQAAEKFSPNLLCNFAFDLAQKYNGFYDVYPIIRAETEELRDFRLTLTSAVAQVLKNSLVLLGISAPARM